jgi:hypothetical protein
MKSSPIDNVPSHLATIEVFERCLRSAGYRDCGMSRGEHEYLINVQIKSMRKFFEWCDENKTKINEATTK